MKMSQVFESAEELKKQITDHMHKRYQEVHPDLPRHGNYHYHSAVDHLRDNAYDHFNKHPKYKSANVHTLAKKVVSSYADNDTAESRANDKRVERAHARRERERNKPLKVEKPKYREVWKKTGSHPGAGYIVKRIPR